MNKALKISYLNYISGLKISIKLNDMFICAFVNIF